MTANVKMVVNKTNIKKQIHAVSTCSPDCPTESAVERALVDLEWRREAASKRNGNTHKINTQVPKTENATVQKGCTRLLPTWVFYSERQCCRVWMHNKYSASPKAKSPSAASSFPPQPQTQCVTNKYIVFKNTKLCAVQQRLVSVSHVPEPQILKTASMRMWNI